MRAVVPTYAIHIPSWRAMQSAGVQLCISFLHLSMTKDTQFSSHHISIVRPIVGAVMSFRHTFRIAQ